MKEEPAAPVEDSNMPPEAEPVPATPESAPANDDTPGSEAESEKVYSKEEADKFAQDRINKITTDKYTERRRAEKAEAELAELKGKPAPEQPEPKLEDFDYDESKFNAALATYHGTKASVDAVSNYKAEQDKVTAEKRQTEINAKFDEKAVKFRETNQDYDTVIMGLPQLPGDVMDEIMQHDNGPQLAHYLGKHLDVAENITLMKLGEISAQLVNDKPIKEPSAAPDPIEPVKPGATLNKDMKDMSMDEIYALPSKR